MSEGEMAGSPMAVPADMLIDRGGAGGGRPPWPALLAAALLHLMMPVLAWLLFLWSPSPSPPREPEVIPVQVVFASPPPPPPVAAPPLPPPLPYAESGPDQRTTAPPPAEALAPEPATPAPAPPPEKPDAPPDKSAKPKPPKEVAHLEPPKKEAETPRAPRPAPAQRLNITPGERIETGDPYLNQLWAIIERHRVFPLVKGQFGLPVEGTAVYRMMLDRSGRIIDIRLEHSSGTEGIDSAVKEMIRKGEPFPPPPANFPAPIPITVAVRLTPPS